MSYPSPGDQAWVVPLTKVKRRPVYYNALPVRVGTVDPDSMTFTLAGDPDVFSLESMVSDRTNRRVLPDDDETKAAIRRALDEATARDEEFRRNSVRAALGLA